MRKIFLLVLFIVLLAVPVSATGFDQSNLIDIMPYLQEEKNLNISNNSVTYNFNFDGRTTITYVDFLVYSNVSSLTATSNNQSLTVVNAGDRFWRIYGDIGGARKSFLDLTLTTTGGAYVELVSARMSQSAVDIFDIEAYCQINTDGYTSTIHYVPTDTINGRGWESEATIENTFVQCFIWTEDWRKYDYIEIQLMLDIASISSISGMLGNDNFDVDISQIYSERWDSNYYYVNLGFDVSQFLRSSDQDPTIYLFGNLKYELLNSITFSSCSGHVYRESSSDLTGILNRIKSAIQNLEVSILNAFSGLNSNIDSKFSNLRTWIQNQTTAIVNAINGDTTPGEDFQEELSSRHEELENMSQIMDSIPKPDFQDIILDIHVDNAALSPLTFQLNTLLTQSIFSSLFLMAFILAIAAYILYGKR